MSISLVQEFITLPESAGKLLLTLGLADLGEFNNKFTIANMINSTIELQMPQAELQAPVLANPMLSESFYEDCLQFASRIIRLEKCNLTSIDIVHDLIVETDINYSNYQKKIRNKILSQRRMFRPLPIESIYYKNNLPFKTNQDFTCNKCKDIFPDSERERSYSSKGYFIEKNTCKNCSNKIKNEWCKNARVQQLPYWFRKLERGRNYYQKNREIILIKNKEHYHKTYNKKEVVKIDWVYEKKHLSDKYIKKLLYKKYKVSEITDEMIKEKRILILNPTPKIKLTIEEKRERNLERYYKKRETYLKKVCEYGKINREKRRLSKLKLKEARNGF